MKIMTDSGPITGNQRHRHMQWLRGRCESGAWTGTETIAAAWEAIYEAVAASRTLHEAYSIGFAQGLADRLYNALQAPEADPMYSSSVRRRSDWLERRLTQRPPTR